MQIKFFGGMVMFILLGILLQRTVAPGTNILGSVMVVIGVGGFINALLLKLGKVAPGKIWGATPLGLSLISIGAIGMGLLIGFADYADQFSSFLVHGGGVVLALLSVLSFGAGLKIESNARAAQGRS